MFSVTILTVINCTYQLTTLTRSCYNIFIGCTFELKYLLTMIHLKHINAITPQALQQLANDADIAKNVRDMFPHPYSIDDARQFISLVNDGVVKHVFVIFSDDTFVGLIGVIPQHDVHRRNGEIGYWLGKPYWGKGYATEAVKQLTNWAFNTLGLHRVYAGVFETNKASMRVLEKAGYKLEAVLKSTIIKNEVVMDEYLYSMLKE